MYGDLFLVGIELAVQAMSFEMLRGRLMGHLRTRIQNGEMTERSLARLTGISQPHIHNVLKGAKILSPELEDKILSSLKISVLDLFSIDELRLQLNRGGNMETYRAISVLDGLLGPGFPMPVQASRGEMHPVAGSLLVNVDGPQLARLVEDPEMQPTVKANALVLLDRSEGARLARSADEYYAVSINGSAVIRILYTLGCHLYAATERTRESPKAWLELPATGEPLSIIHARVVWLE